MSQNSILPVEAVISARARRICLWLIGLLLVAIPLMLWGRGYMVGGDETRLYYMYPWEYLTKYLPNLISDNQLSALGYYYSRLYAAPLVVIVLILKAVLPFVQTANLMFGLNIAAGFLGFYYLLGLWFKNDSQSYFLIRVAASLFYVSSTFMNLSIWQNQLFVVYMVGVFPWALYLFIKGVREDKARTIVLSVLILSLFSVVLMSVPWLLAIIILSSPILAVEFLNHKRAFLKSLGLFVSLLIVINLYWLFHFVYSPFSTENASGSIVSSTTADDFRADNVYLIKSVSKYNTLLYPMFGLFHNELQADYGWASYETYAHWNLRLLPWGVVLPLIVLAPLLYWRRVGRDRKLYLAAIISWLIGLFMFTAKIGNWGTDFFVQLNNVVPGFVMFRNMYDKFGPALSFSYALLLAISLKIAFEAARRRWVPTVILVLLLVFTLLQAGPFIFQPTYRLPLRTTAKTIVSVERLNGDFLDLASYLKTFDKTHRLVWLPLNQANYVQVRDENRPDNYYSGLSPLQFLSGVNDLSGWLSFNERQRARIFDAMAAGDSGTIGEAFRQLDIGYVIVNHDISSDLQQSYLYRTEYGQQTPALIESLIGDKIKDFGARYSLYKINARYANQKIYTDGGATVSFDRVADYQYKIHISDLTTDQRLIFLDPYQKQWRLSLTSGADVVATHDQIFDYANVWNLQLSQLGPAVKDGSVDLELLFQPQRYSAVVEVISGLALLLALVFIRRSSAPRP